jgi:pimeloyl-ACP methyl ester carboxylesterase
VLTGEFDGACNPRLNAVIDDALPESELVVLPALRHSVLVEGPERVLPPVLDFLLRHRD